MSGPSVPLHGLAPVHDAHHQLGRELAAVSFRESGEVGGTVAEIAGERAVAAAFRPWQTAQ
jgi:hypothetical protein